MLPEFQPVTGKYEVLRQLSEGGMGAIYLARHRLLDELRVIKVMRTSIREDPEFRDRFVREARSAIQLRHPNLTQLYEFEADEGGTAFMVLEYIDGRTLEELIEAKSIASLRLKVAIAVQCLRALAFLHRKGFVHRDIAPDNIMLTRDTEGGPLVKLLDLGIVKVVAGDGGHTGTAVFLGKFRYASPEQLESSNIDHRSDLYSFGILLYELLTGVYPIAGTDMRSIMSGHLFRPPIAFADSDPEEEIPEPLRALVLSALEKDPKRRPQSAEEFARRIAAIELPAEHEAAQVTLPINLDRILGERGAAEPRHKSTQEEIDRRFDLDKKTPTPAVYRPSAATPVDEFDTLLAEAAAKLDRGDLDGAEAGARAVGARAGVSAAASDRARHLLTTVRERRCGLLTAEAGQALAAGKVGAATEALNRVLRLDPDYAEARKLVVEIGRRIERESLEDRRERNLAQLRQRIEAALERDDVDLARAWLDEVAVDSVPEEGRRELAARIASYVAKVQAPTIARTAIAPPAGEDVTREVPRVEPQAPAAPRQEWTETIALYRRPWLLGALAGTLFLVLLFVAMRRPWAPRSAPISAPSPTASAPAPAAPPATAPTPPPAIAKPVEPAAPRTAPAAVAPVEKTPPAAAAPPSAAELEAARLAADRRKAAELALRARRYFEVGSYAEAADLAQQALALDPANESATRTVASLPLHTTPATGTPTSGPTRPPATSPAPATTAAKPPTPTPPAAVKPVAGPPESAPATAPSEPAAAAAEPLATAPPAASPALAPRRRWTVTACGLITRLVGGGAVSSLKLAPGTLESIETRFLEAGAAVDGVGQLRILFAANGVAEPGLHVPNNSAEMRFIRQIAPELKFQPAWVDTKPRDIECTLVRSRG